MIMLLNIDPSYSLVSMTSHQKNRFLAINSSSRCCSRWMLLVVLCNFLRDYRSIVSTAITPKTYTPFKILEPHLTKLVASIYISNSFLQLCSSTSSLWNRRKNIIFQALNFMIPVSHIYLIRFITN